ncbi:hypothetical protein F5B21DRAFT_487171 [Xylaria acuta]|nr:hypothetical protein F5B21DRAFT_487171 [Xylaria acuta]
MPPAQRPSTETSRNVAMLRGFLQQSGSKHRVAPLVAAIMARDVDIHERMLTDLGNRMQQMEKGLSGRSEHTTRVLERMQHVEQDAKSLRELIQADGQRNIDARLDPDQLKAELTEAINQHSTEITSVGQRLQTIQEAIKGQQQTANQVKEILDTFGKRIESLQSDISGLKDGIDKVPFAAPITERIAKLEERIVKCLDQNSNDAEITKLSLAAVKMNPDPQEELEHVTDQPTNDTHIPGDCPTGQSEPNPEQPDLEEWPAIADFVTVYENFLESYKSKKPGDDLKFIEAFLDEINQVNVHVSCALQRYLLETYPKKVILITSEVRQQYPGIFIELVRISWNDIRRAIAKLRDLRIFQWASNDGISGPSPTPITR